MVIGEFLNSKFYELNDDLAMGSPLSPLFADIFMNHIEEKILYSKNI